MKLACSHGCLMFVETFNKRLTLKHFKKLSAEAKEWAALSAWNPVEMTWFHTWPACVLQTILLIQMIFMFAYRKEFSKLIFYILWIFEIAKVCGNFISQRNVHNHLSLSTEDKVAQTQWAEVKHILFAYQYQRLQEKKHFSGISWSSTAYSSSWLLQKCTRVHTGSPNVLFFVMRETSAHFVTRSANLPGIL